MYIKELLFEWNPNGRMVDLLWEGLEKGEDMLGVRRALRSIVASRER